MDEYDGAGWAVPSEGPDGRSFRMVIGLGGGGDDTLGFAEGGASGRRRGEGAGNVDSPGMVMAMARDGMYRLGASLDADVEAL